MGSSLVGPRGTRQEAVMSPGGTTPDPTASLDDDRRWILCARTGRRLYGFHRSRAARARRSARALDPRRHLRTVSRRVPAPLLWCDLARGAWRGSGSPVVLVCFEQLTQ